MWDLNNKGGWVLKNWCFQIVVLERLLSPLDCKESQPVHPEGNQFWVFSPQYWKDWCWSWNSNTLATWWEGLTHWKRPWCGKDWEQEEKETTEDEMVGWHHWLNGHEFGWSPGVGDRQGGLACCSSWGHKESDTTEWLNWTDLKDEHVISLPIIRLKDFSSL